MSKARTRHLPVTSASQSRCRPWRESAPAVWGHRSGRPSPASSKETGVRAPATSRYAYRPVIGSNSGMATHQLREVEQLTQGAQVSHERRTVALYGERRDTAVHGEQVIVEGGRLRLQEGQPVLSIAA